MKPLVTYLKNPERAHRTYIAMEDKSWSSKGVDPLKIIDDIAKEDPYVAVQIKLVNAFGLRKKEACCFRPWVCIDADGNTIQVYDGTKGGKYRVIPITNDYQRTVLSEAKKIAPGMKDFVGNPRNTLEQNLWRLDYLLKKHKITKADLGITLHGLRHEYSNNRYAEITGRESPVRGGSTAYYTSEEGKKGRQLLSQELGHGRIQITGAYTGGVATKQTVAASITKDAAPGSGLTDEDSQFKQD